MRYKTGLSFAYASYLLRNTTDKRAPFAHWPNHQFCSTVGFSALLRTRSLL